MWGRTYFINDLVKRKGSLRDLTVKQVLDYFFIIPIVFLCVVHEFFKYVLGINKLDRQGL